jgi:hypothetical protein
VSPKLVVGDLELLAKLNSESASQRVGKVAGSLTTDVSYPTLAFTE